MSLRGRLVAIVGIMIIAGAAVIAALGTASSAVPNSTLPLSVELPPLIPGQTSHGAGVVAINQDAIVSSAVWSGEGAWSAQLCRAQICTPFAELGGKHLQAGLYALLVDIAVPEEVVSAGHGASAEAKGSISLIDGTPNPLLVFGRRILPILLFTGMILTIGGLVLAYVHRRQERR